MSNMNLSIVFLGLIVLLEPIVACSSSGGGGSFQASSESSEAALASLRKVPLEQTAPENLTFTAGDIISCTLSSLASHIMLASNSTTVIHGMEFALGERGRAIIEEENFLEVAERLFEKCDVITSWYDEQIQESCHKGQNYTIKTTEEAIANARATVEYFSTRHTLYSLFRCNCEHWVSSWKYGVAWTTQPGLLKFMVGGGYASEECKANGVRSCP